MCVEFTLWGMCPVGKFVWGFALWGFALWGIALWGIVLWGIGREPYLLYVYVWSNKTSKISFHSLCLLQYILYTNKWLNERSTTYPVLLCANSMDIYVNKDDWYKPKKDGYVFFTHNKNLIMGEEAALQCQYINFENEFVHYGSS